MPYLTGALAALACVLVLEFCSDAALVDWMADAFVLMLGGRKAVIKVRTMRAEQRYRRAIRRLRGQLASSGAAAASPHGARPGEKRSNVISVLPPPKRRR
jgi:hypothetical protein